MMLLDTWHLAQDFDTPPGILTIHSYRKPSDRTRHRCSIGNPNFILIPYFHYARPMPVYSNPATIFKEYLWT